ncbi:hypothetical protein Q4493_13445 [Colwellia sp. 1_MG-2023]|uniref:hypothetical protein n=1 Tax=Colwellia sp. 1_MG-2023 TaxID=3062649 RepID=UPI0026E1E500|nr:hypothetical protein [Colwellia sp. 1_MG-2023]MDO6446783.1 hypothetical protein [Colwellia sp. 1_MG-2023]
MLFRCYLTIIYTSLLSFALISCGGGSSTTTPKTEEVTVTPPATNTFSTQVIYRNACDMAIPSEGAKLLIHDDDFDVIDVITADDNGFLTYETTDETIDVSIIFGQKDNYDDYVIKAITLMQSPVTQVAPIYQSTFSTEGCHCETIEPELISNDIQLPANKTTFNTLNSNIHYRVKKTEIGTKFNANLCQLENGSWPAIYSTLWFWQQEELHGIVIDDYQIEDLYEGEQIFVSEKASNLNYSVSNMENEEDVKISLKGILDETMYVNQSSSLVFESFPMDFYQFSASHYESYPIENSLYLMKVTQNNTKLINDINTEISFVIPEYSDQLIIETLTHEDGRYDLTSFDKIKVFSQYIMFQYTNGYLVDWEYYGPEIGTSISDKKLDISQIFDVESLDIYSVFLETISGFGIDSINNYEDYIKKVKLNKRYYSIGSETENISSFSIQSY